jgi:hypothetical protein
MASFHTISEELRLGTDSQILLRTFSFVREASENTPREEIIVLIELPDRPRGGEELIQTIFQTLKEICFLDQNQDSYERFEAALKEINAVIVEAREALPNKTLGRINALIGFISNNELHLTQTGEAEAYLIRQGALTTVTEGLMPNDSAVDIFVNIASGNIQNLDKILLVSERLLRYATKNELAKKIFSPHKEIGLALEELDEIIVLEGAQTTGILAFDVVTEATASKVIASNRTNLEKNKFQSLVKQASHSLNWLRDRIPEGTNLPSNSKLKLDKNYLILGFLIVVILILLSVSWGFGKNRSSVKAEEVRLALESIQTDIDTAQSRINIGDKTKAYELLASAEIAAEDLIKAGLAIEEAQTKKLIVSQKQDELANIRRYLELTPLVDLAQTKADVSLVGLLDYHSRKIAFDANSLFDTTLDQISGTTELDPISVVRAGKYFTDRDSLVFITTDGKVIEWRDGDPVLVDTEDEAWKSAIDVGVYSTYIYLLDQTNNQIWKYQRKRDIYSSAVAYNESADLTKAVSIAIDGDIWVLANDADNDMSNDIIRIRKGQKKPLRISDLPDSVWENPRKIYTSEKLRNIYVLDQNNKRILRFYKDPAEAGVETRDLIYDTQYLFEGLENVQDFWVDSSEQKLFVIDGQKIYEVVI